MSEELSSTKQRILDAAEALFAQNGFTGASLRQVTSMAKVNLAAVNYHFGSKDKLVEEVLRRRLDVLNKHRLDALAALRDTASIENVLEAFIRPAMELLAMDHGGMAFRRVMARAYAEQDNQLRQFLSAHYSNVLRQFAHALAERLPTLDKAELYWRLDIVIGALTYAMADFGIIQRRPDSSEEQHLEQAVQHLVHFAAAGMRSA
ncbi:MAG TPA: TetR/AcrR family transcriptional regulator [Rhodanobacteraceae bacterium]